MPSANRCPECRETVHPFAAICPNCSADLDAHRRQRAARATQPSRLRAPRLGTANFGIGTTTTDVAIITLAMLLMALFAPLFGSLFSLFIVWHANQNGFTARRNLAIFFVALSIFDLLAPNVLLPHLIL